MSKKKIIIALVLVWAAVFVASYFLSKGIDGPRNLDTGFKRLDVLARYQFIAFGVAVVSAVLGIIWKRDNKQALLLGFFPLAATALLVAALIVGSMIFNPRLTPEEAYQPPKTTTPVAEPAAQQ